MKKRSILRLLLIVIIMATALTGCNNKLGNKTPFDAIVDAFGNQEFKISFSSEGLEYPIEDMSYTASVIPKLPTPERVGYIFAGWYMDPAYITPYIDGILHLYMQNVTLYAKWEKESFVQSGIYDIEYTASILEETVKKGELTDKYGGYMDFTESLLTEEIYIEKSGDRLLLRLQYDSVYTLPMFSSSTVYTVTPSRMNVNDVFISEKIDSLADPVKTVFIDITNFNLEDTLYLEVQTTNWTDNTLTDADRLKTVTKYTVAIDITRIIGFSKPYIDINTPLEEGYYLVKSYYKQISNKDTMMESFNPVYSYLYSNGKTYTLIKQHIPFAGLVSSSGVDIETSKDSYYNRMMALTPVQLYYGIANPPVGNSEVASDYFPETYGGEYYGNFAIEYHADTGKFYNIFDLGSDLTKEYVVMNGFTGFMEVAMGMGYQNQILTIDESSIIRLAEVDYTPLEGDAYQYETNMQYYPGSISDINEKGLAYDAMLKYGLSTNMINFYFTTEDLSLPEASRKQFSSRITVTPTVGTNAKPVSEQRYEMAYFNVNAEVFGYDVTSGENLYADSLTVKSMGDGAYRENLDIVSGKSVQKADTIKLAELYAEKVSSTNDFSAVEWKVYTMVNGEVDYNSIVTLKNPVFTFESDVAVLFIHTDENGFKNKTLVEIAEYTEPTIFIEKSEEFPFDENAVYAVGETVSYPDLSYSWMGHSEKMSGILYPVEIGTEGYSLSVNIVRIGVFKVDNGLYTLQYPSPNTTTFVVPAESTLLVFELHNKYGERYFHTITMTSASRIEYEVLDNNGNCYANDYVKYDADGNRREISESLYAEILNSANYQDLLGRAYSLKIGESGRELDMVSCKIVTEHGTEELGVSGSAEEKAKQIWAYISDRDYAIIHLQFENGIDSLQATFLYRVTFNGKFTAQLFTYNDYFENYTYTFAKPILYDSKGNQIGTASVSSNNTRYAKITNDILQYHLTFTEKGDYRLIQTFSVNGLSFRMAQDVHVWSDTEDITITYVTDAEHPFADGTLEMTVTYNLSEAIYTLKKNSFSSSVPSSHVLYGWSATMGEVGKYRSGTVIEEFISDFHSKNITLYAHWDKGLTVTVKAEGNQDYIFTKYLGNFGYYSIDVRDFKTVVPDGYVLAGWQSPLWENKIVDSIRNIYSNRIDWDNPESFVITAVFKKEYTVKYEIDVNYSTAFFRNEIVVDGNGVKLPENKMNVACFPEGYEFKGWYIQGDESQTFVDLSSYIVTGDVTFVAKFGAIEE